MRPVDFRADLGTSVLPVQIRLRTERPGELSAAAHLCVACRKIFMQSDS